MAVILDKFSESLRGAVMHVAHTTLQRALTFSGGGRVAEYRFTLVDR